MEESKIVIAIKKFLADYAWDKSLMAPRCNASKISTSVTEHSNTALEDFVRSFKNATRE